MIDLEAVFKKYEGEYLRFARIENKRHPRPDLCAFLLLDALVPNAGRDMVSAAEHDEIYLDTDIDELARAATDDDILTLVRCGVRHDSDTDSLSMFV